MAQAEPAAGAPEYPAAVRAAVIGEEPHDPDPVGREPAHGPDEEASRHPALLVGQELRVHEANGGVIAARIRAGSSAQPSDSCSDW